VWAYRRIGVTMSLVMRIFDKPWALRVLTILFENKTPPGEDAHTPTRPYPDTSPHVASVRAFLLLVLAETALQGGVKRFCTPLDQLWQIRPARKTRILLSIYRRSPPVEPTEVQNRLARKIT
jgi:hypothetical protein